MNPLMPEHPPLVGRRIVVTRAGAEAESLAARLRDLGAVPLVRPLIAITPPADPTPLDTALRELGNVDWLICTSANAVAAIIERLRVLGNRAGRPATLRVGAVGSATAAAFAAAGWRVDRIPATQTAAGLATAFDDISGKRILIPASALARPILADSLRARGATVQTLVAYRTVIVPPVPGEPLIGALQAGTIDAVTLTSPSTVRGLLPFLTESEQSPAHPALVCIGSTTADAAREANLTVSAVAASHSAPGLIDALLGLFGRSPALAIDRRDTRREIQP